MNLHGTCTILLLINYLTVHVTYGKIFHAILHLENGLKQTEICAAYNSDYSGIPTELSSSQKLHIYQIPFQSNCVAHSDDKIKNSSSFITTDGNCSFFKKLLFAYEASAKQVILVSNNQSLWDFPVGSSEEHRQVNISVGTISNKSLNKAINLIGSPEFAQMYRPEDPLFDPNLIVIWFIAAFTVVVGAYWSGQTLKHEIETNDGTEAKNSDLPPLSVKMILIFIVMICITLLLLYFFFKYLIYVVIAIFAMASTQGTYDCIMGIRSCLCHHCCKAQENEEPLLEPKENIFQKLLNCGHCRLPENNLPVLKSRPDLCTIIVFLFSLSLSIFWVIIRNDQYAWILQDTLGICLCIHFLKTIRLPNLKVSSILLVLLLLYDIFFVFITPFFSARGKSIMEKVATGHGGKEQLPMVIKVPLLTKTAISVCGRPYSLLGFGDILIPGLFLSFCHNFDVKAKTKFRIYFVATSIAYGFGLVITFVALLLMRSGQPALLYLAPSVLIAAVVVGIYRKEIKELWTGQIGQTILIEQPTTSEQNVA